MECICGGRSFCVACTGRALPLRSRRPKGSFSSPSPDTVAHSSLYLAQIYQPVDSHGKVAPSQAAPYAKWEPQTRIQNKLPESPTGPPDFCAAPATHSLQPFTLLEGDFSTGYHVSEAPLMLISLP